MGLLFAYWHYLINYSWVLSYIGTGCSDENNCLESHDSFLEKDIIVLNMCSYLNHFSFLILCFFNFWMLYFLIFFNFSLSFSFLMLIFELSFLKCHLFSVFVLIFSSPEVEIRPLGRYSIVSLLSVISGSSIPRVLA